MDDIEVLSEIVLAEWPGVRCVRRWLRGIHKDRGKILCGFTGWETVEEKDIVALHRFEVID